MLQQNILPEFNNKLEKELINLFHSLDLPLHFNKTGNKEFTNYQRISIIILFHRSKKSLREFIVEFRESKWISWLGLSKIPQKSTLHDWIQIFSMKIIHKISKVLLPEKIKLTSVDGTAIDSWQRSRHYEKRAEEMGKLIYMPPVKAGIFIDVESQSIIDFEFVTNNKHDVKLAEKIFRRNTLKNIRGFGDKGFDSENLHEIARANGIDFYAPIRKMHKWGSKNQKPKGFYRRKCIKMPEDYSMRNINETVNSVLKRTQIPFLLRKNDSRKEKEFGWQVVWYNLKRKIMFSFGNEGQTFFCVISEFIVSGQSRVNRFLFKAKNLLGGMLKPEERTKIIEVNERARGLADRAVGILSEEGLNVSIESVKKIWREEGKPIYKMKEVLQIMVKEYHSKGLRDPGEIARAIGKELVYYLPSETNIKSYISNLKLSYKEVSKAPSADSIGRFAGRKPQKGYELADLC